MYPWVIRWFRIAEFPFAHVCQLFSSCPAPPSSSNSSSSSSSSSSNVSLISVLNELGSFEHAWTLHASSFITLVLHWTEREKSSLSMDWVTWLALHSKEEDAKGTVHLTFLPPVTSSSSSLSQDEPTVDDVYVAWLALLCRHALIINHMDLLKSNLNQLLSWVQRVPPLPAPSSSSSTSSSFSLILKSITFCVQDLAQWTSSMDSEDFDNPYNSSYMFIKNLIHDTLSQLIARYVLMATTSLHMGRHVFEWLMYLASILPPTYSCRF
ncbi:hypothetical protein HMI55_005193 [Coelomomyces lativittatus]|nr:hypothetical protein HMI55_005193 [Coelomomyces lativittatus]